MSEENMNDVAAKLEAIAHGDTGFYGHEQAVLLAAVAEIRRLVEQMQLTYCAYCGHQEPVDDEAASKITEHVKVCPEHPMRAAEARLKAVEERGHECPDVNCGLVVPHTAECAIAERMVAGLYPEARHE